MSALPLKNNSFDLWWVHNIKGLQFAISDECIPLKDNSFEAIMSALPLKYNSFDL